MPRWSCSMLQHSTACHRTTPSIIHRPVCREWERVAVCGVLWLWTGCSSVCRQSLPCSCREEETLRASSPNLTMDEGQEQEPVKKKPNELDDIVDLVFYLTADRLNEQRSPLPALRSFPQPVGDTSGLDLSPLAHSTTSTTTVDRQHSSEQTSSQANSSTDTSVFSTKEGGGVTPIRSRNCSPNVSAMTNSSLAPDGPKGEGGDKVAGIR